ncbi:MAG TPA: GAF domain-containing protein [Thermoanaerobaculia bacterium]
MDAARIGALAEASELLRETLPGKEVPARLVDLCARIVPEADAVAMWRLQAREKTWCITASRGLSDEYCAITLPERGGGSSARLLQAPFIVNDPEHWDAAENRGGLYVSEGIRKMLVLPLMIRGEAEGTICCYFRHDVTLSDADFALAKTFAGIASTLLSAQKLDRLAEVARQLSAELDLDRLMQTITEAATELTGAQFGAFFYNVVNAGGESYMLYTIAGVPREEFSKFPMPRNTAVFDPTFTGSGTIRSANIRKDPRYGHNAPYHGIPKGHLPVVSYLAVPVIARSGEVLGGLFFGHEEEGVFTESEERMAESLAGQAAVAIDNARLYRALQEDRARATREEQRYRALLFATPTPLAIGITTADGRIEEESRSWRELTGQTVEEMREGQFDALHEFDRERVRAAWQRAVATETPFEETYRVRMRDGSYRWFAGKAVPVYDTDQRVLEWVWASTDVHDAKVSEDSLRFLAKATELFASSLDYGETLKTLTSLAVPEMADWCAVDLLEGTEIERLAVAHVDPAKVEYARELRRRFPPDPRTDQVAVVMRSGRSQLVSTIPDGLLEELVPDAEQLRIARELGLMSWMIVPLRSRGNALGAVTFVSSDSRRRYTERDLALAEEFARRAAVAIDNARLYGDAQSANRAKDEFLATLSHELRTPLTAILGWARLLRMGMSPEESETAVVAIEQSAQAQAQLIDDILDVSRIMAGKLRIEPHAVDLRTVAQAALATVRPAADAKDIHIEAHFPEVVPPVWGDEGRLQQVAWNLLSNAIKFTPRGGRVEARIDVEEALVRLVVTDTGQGISAEFLPHVFEPFRQADSSTTRVYGGIGLGLAIVRYLVELHGGSVSASSEGTGRGATFTVALPLLGSRQNVGRVAPAGGVVTGDPATQTLPSLGGARVLTIDDQAYSRDVIVAILRRCGATADAAESVREAFERLGAARPDLIVCDIAMPHEDGYAFVRELRLSSDAALRALPVIALTAFGRETDRATALASGFDAYLKKPVDPAELANAVRELLDRRPG